MSDQLKPEYLFLLKTDTELQTQIVALTGRSLRTVCNVIKNNDSLLCKPSILRLIRDKLAPDVIDATDLTQRVAFAPDQTRVGVEL